MRLIKLALISFLSLALLVTVISLLIPSTVHISKAVNLKAPKDSVLAQLQDAGNWRNWYPGIDTAKPLIVDGVVKGAYFSVDTVNAVMLKLDQVSSSGATALFTGRNMRQVENRWTLIEHPGSDSLTVQWYMDFNLRWYPWEKFASLLFETSYGIKMEQGLNALRDHVQH